MRGDGIVEPSPLFEDPSRADDFSAPAEIANDGLCDPPGVPPLSRVNTDSSNTLSGRSATTFAGGTSALTPEADRVAFHLGHQYTMGEMATEENRHFTALAAVVHHPSTTNEGGSFTITENQVVNAVTAAVPSSILQPDARLVEMNSLRHISSFEGARSRLHGPDSPPMEMDQGSLSSMSDGDDVEMDRIVQNLLGQTTRWSSIATVANNGTTCHEDMVMDYDSSLAEDNPSPLTIPDDELKDFLRFYPDEEDYFYRNVAGYSQRESTWHDVNLDDFYQAITYESTISDPPQIPVPAPEFATAGIDPLDNPPEDETDWHPASFVHTTSIAPNPSQSHQ